MGAILKRSLGKNKDLQEINQQGKINQQEL